MADLDTRAEDLAEFLSRWNTPTDPYFVIHGRAGHVGDDRDPYLPIAEAILGWLAGQEGRGTVRCSCGQTWENLTRAQAEAIARDHDDSPLSRHVVSSELFIAQRAQAGASR